MPIVIVEEKIELASRSSVLAAVAVLPSGADVVLVTLPMTTPDVPVVVVVLPVPVVLSGVTLVASFEQELSKTVAKRNRLHVNRLTNE
jgi:hypothetical protein